MINTFTQKQTCKSLKDDIKHYTDNEFKEHCESLDMNETWDKFKDNDETKLQATLDQY